MPADVFKKELRLNLICATSNKPIERGGGLNSDRTGKHLHNNDFERDMFKSCRPGELKLNKSRERVAGKDSEKTKKADKSTKDLMQSIFKIKRNKV